MPRKRSDEIDIVLQLAASALNDWELIRIEGMSQHQVTDALRRSALFLSFSEREGFGMPPLEALACGCYVIGFDGFGGREYLDPRFATRVEDGNLITFGEALTSWLEAYEETSEMRDRRAQASSFALETYSLNRESEDVVVFYEHFVERATTRWNVPEESIVFELPPLGPNRWRTAASRLTSAIMDVAGGDERVRKALRAVRG